MPPKRIVKFLIFIALGLTLVSITGQFLKYYGFSHSPALIEKLNVDGEYTIPSLFSSFSLLFCSVLLGKISYEKWQINDQYIGKWVGLSILFFYLALDETISLHEQLIHPLRDALNTTGIFYYAWVIPGLTLVCIVAFIYWQFLLALPEKIKYLFFLAGILYVGGGIGMEMLGGYYAYLYDTNNFVYQILTTIEELLEMLGIIIFIYGLLSYRKLRLS